MSFEELLARRAAIPDDASLPLSMTRAERDALRRQAYELDCRIRHARDALATLAATPEPDMTWLNHLIEWRATLFEELRCSPSEPRKPRQLGLRNNLTLSMRCIDYGPDDALQLQCYDLSTLRLGQLMLEAGYTPIGAKPEQHYAGMLPWHGSLREVEKQHKDIAKRRADAQQRLDDALMDDDERAKREADAQAYRDAINSMRIQRTADGDGYCVVDGDGDIVDEKTLSTVQRQALARMRERDKPVATSHG